MEDRRLDEVKSWRVSRGIKTVSFAMERVMGIEPTSKAWEAAVLPLNYTRVHRILFGF